MSTPLKTIVLNNLESFSSLKGVLLKQFDDLMKDESLPLSERWKLFLIHANSILPVGNWHSNFPKAVSNFITDNMYDFQRYQTYKYSDIFDDYLLEEWDNPCEEDIEVVEKWVKENEVIVRAIITSGVCGTIWDW